MKITRTNFALVMCCALAVVAVLALCGYPLISPDTFGALGAAGALPFAMSGEIGGDARQALDKVLDAAKSAKSAVDDVKKAHVELDGRVSKLSEELKSGQVDAVTKAAYQDAVTKVDKVEKSLEKVNLEVTELAKKAASLFSGNPQNAKSIGQLASESDVCKSYAGGVATLVTLDRPMFGKAAVTSAAASAGALVQPHRVGDVIMGPAPILTIRDLLQSVSIASNLVEWVREKLFTNNAGPQNGEGAVKNESAITFEKKSNPVETIAHWIPISRQVLADAPQLQGLLDGRMRVGLKLKEEEGILFGDGVNGSLLGLTPQATAYVPAGIPAGASQIDHLRWAFLQVAKAQYPATFAVLSLEDWALIQMMKTTDGAYIFGTPTDGAAPRIWGKSVVEAYSMPAGSFLAGSGLAATVYDREEVTVRIAEQHEGFFIKNMVALLCEERLALTVERPTAIVSGTFP